MTKTAKALIVTAAMTGLMAGTVLTGCASNDSAGTKASDTAASKHDCKGKNSCKGKGGCKVA